MDPDEVAHYEPPHQDLRCLQIQLFSSLVVKELKPRVVYNLVTSKVGQYHDEIISELFAGSKPYSLKVLSEATGLFFKHIEGAKTYKCRLLSALSCWRVHRNCGELV